VPLLVAAGCATRFERVLADMRTARDAVAIFGPPATEETLPTARLRREWTVREDEAVPGQYVSREVYIGHDREGYPEFITREVFIPEHLLLRRCRLVLVSDAATGILLERSWQGNACERLLSRLPATEDRQRKRNGSSP
jgi:hypothetical protein